MTNKILFRFSLIFIAVFGCTTAAIANEKSHTKIECELEPIVRGAKSEKELTSHGRDSYHLVGILESSSLNWSGYATVPKTRITAGTVTAVTGSWTVPHLTATPDDAYSSIWVGIDGYSSNTVEQIGTEQDWINGSQQNYAWFEMYPAGSYMLVGFPVDVGDSITANVHYVGRNTFQLTIYNNTKRVYAVIPSSYTRSSNALRSSAEWIVEAPSDGSGVLPLANFVSATLTNCSATISNKTGPINYVLWKFDQLNMVTSGGTVKALTSNLVNSGKGFTVLWEHE